MTTLSNSISIEGISYGWEKFNVIENFSQVFVRGKIYYITGKNGSGKTTLLNLICGILHPLKGRIKYNDTDIEELDMFFIRKKLTAVAEQRDFLENENLSGGERRKKAIIRAYSKNADLLFIVYG